MSLINMSYRMSLINTSYKRVTSFKTVLTRLSIDHIPQCVNILICDNELVDNNVELFNYKDMPNYLKICVHNIKSNIWYCIFKFRTRDMMCGVSPDLHETLCNKHDELLIREKSAKRLIVGTLIIVDHINHDIRSYIIAMYNGLL